MRAEKGVKAERRPDGISCAAPEKKPSWAPDPTSVWMATSAATRLLGLPPLPPLPASSWPVTSRSTRSMREQRDVLAEPRYLPCEALASSSRVFQWTSSGF